MKENVKKFLLIFIIGLLILCGVIYISYAAYKTNVSGNSITEIATPKIRIISENNYNENDDEYANTATTHIKELDNTSVYSNQFKVVNYDEQNYVTEVGMNYKLKLSYTDKLAPIDLKLYKIENDGTEKEVVLNEKLETTDFFEFIANKKEEQNYRVELNFNLSSGKMEKNVDVKVDVIATQVSPT